MTKEQADQLRDRLRQHDALATLAEAAGNLASYNNSPANEVNLSLCARPDDGSRITGGSLMWTEHSIDAAARPAFNRLHAGIREALAAFAGECRKLAEEV